MVWKTINDLFEFQKKSKIKAGDGQKEGKYFLFSSSMIVDKFLDDYQFENEALIMGTGGNASIHYSSGKFSTTTDCYVLEPKTQNVLTKYAYIYLKRNIHILEKGFRGVGLKHTNQKYIKQITIPIFSMEIQKRIIKAYDKTQKQIEFRKEQLQFLDILTKSRFIEMFGDCRNRVSIGESGLIISDGNYSSKYPRSEDFVKEGIPFIRANNIQAGTVIDDDMYHISLEQHEILQKGHLISGDVLVTTRGNIGQTAIVPERHSGSNINAQIVLLRDMAGRFFPEYLSWALQKADVQEQFSKLQTGTALKQLPVGQLRKVVIIEPPIEQQAKFSSFAQQVDKSKFEVQKGINKLELLKNTLMQQYFG